MITTSTETWQHKDILTNGIRMHYVTQGQGPLIVLLHGFPEYWYSWRLQIPVLAEQGYTVVAPDLRGYNDTDKPRKGYDIPTLLGDIQGLIQGLGFEKAVVVGHDWGGVLAWCFASSYPQMTERLIVLNAPHPLAMQREMRTLSQLRKSWYVFFFQLPWLPEFGLGRRHAHLIGEMLYKSAVQKSAFPYEVTNHYRDAMSKPGALTAALNYYRQLGRRNGLASRDIQGSAISAPTLLIWGEQDIALGAALTENLDAWIEHLEVRRIPDSGHWVQQEKPEQVSAWMLEFLKKPV